MYYTIVSTAPELRLELSAEFLSNPTNIHTITFNNQLGAVRLTDKNDMHEAFIPYSDIEYFDVQLSGMGSSNSNRRSYDVVMNLKNLSSWHLVRLYNKDAADEELKRIIQAVQLSSRDQVIAKPQLAEPSITKTKEGNKTILRWRNTVTTGHVRKVAGWTLVFGVAMFGLLRVLQSNNASTGGYLIFMIFFLLFVGAVATQVKLAMKDKTTAYGFSFSPTEVEYFEESISTSKKTKSVIIPIAQWFGLSYSNSSEYGQSILMLSEQGYKNYRSQKQTGTKFAQMVKALEKSNDFQKLRLKELSPLQRLSLVNWVSDEIKKNKTQSTPSA